MDTNKTAELILQKSNLKNLTPKNKEMAIRFIKTCLQCKNPFNGLGSAMAEAAAEKSVAYKLFIENHVLESDLLIQIDKYRLSKK